LFVFAVVNAVQSVVGTEAGASIQPDASGD